MRVDPLKNQPGFRLDLTQPLPSPSPMPSGNLRQAWTLLLDDGVGCVFLTGATGIIHGDRINYQCSDSNPSANEYDYVIGDLEPGRVWLADRVTTRIDASGNVQIERETTTG